MLRIVIVLLVSLLGCVAAFSQGDDVGHLRLKDRLDRPQDGYCLDILGVGRSLRLELPIFAHNCKSRLTPDSAITLRSDGKIMFSDVRLCITAAGVNGRALPGASIVLRPCGHSAPFFESGQLQTFVFQKSGEIILKDSSLCLAVGGTSDTTYSAQDRWRVLSVEDCKATSPKYLRWEFHKRPFVDG